MSRAIISIELDGSSPIHFFDVSLAGAVRLVRKCALVPRPLLLSATLRCWRQFDQRPLRAGEVDASVVAGLHGATLSHIRDLSGAGELPARARIAPNHPVGGVFAGDFVNGNVCADPDTVLLRADEGGPLGGGLGFCPDG